MSFKVELKSQNGRLFIGEKEPVKVNCNVGANTLEQMEYERKRLAAIYELGLFPDSFMDLSIGRFDNPLYNRIIHLFGCPVGIVPAYLFTNHNSLTKTEAVETLKRLADDGLSFFTLHLTASKELFEIATKKRRIPVTSRGGSIVLRQMLKTDTDNIWRSILPDIITIAKEYGIVVSLGATFRPAGIEEACDEVHILETEEQLKMCQLLQAEGVQVMVENVGHISLNRLEKHCELLRQFNAPIMPLGPFPTDCAENEDNIASAIGASLMGYYDCAHMINCITRSEHTKPCFCIEETLEAIKTAKLAAHIIDVAKGINTEDDVKLFNKRSSLKNCLGEANGDCVRCANYCPLKFGMKYGTKN